MLKIIALLKEIWFIARQSWKITLHEAFHFHGNYGGGGKREFGAGTYLHVPPFLFLIIQSTPQKCYQEYKCVGSQESASIALR